MSAKILAIDDESAILSFYGNVLTREGHSVEQESNPIEGIRKASLGGYDLILCDLKMAPIHGMSTSAILQKIANEVPIIVISGYIDEPTHNMLEQFPNVAAIHKKPISIDTLKDAVGEALKSNQSDD